MPLPTIKSPTEILYNVTIYDMPRSTLRHQVSRDGTLVEEPILFEEWLELEAKRIGRTGMPLGLHYDHNGAVALVVTRRKH